MCFPKNQISQHTHLFPVIQFGILKIILFPAELKCLVKTFLTDHYEPNIAHHVASIIVKSIQDILDSKPGLKESHFYVCECGSGLGRFGFYCIKEINELLKSNELSNIKFIF